MEIIEIPTCQLLLFKPSARFVVKKYVQMYSDSTFVAIHLDLKKIWKKLTEYFFLSDLFKHKLCYTRFIFL